MEIKIANIRIPVDKKADLKQWVIKRYHLQAGHVEQFRIIRSSVDARNKKKIVYDYQVYVRLSKPYPHLLKQADVFPYQPPVMPEYMPWKHFHAPVVVGFGPAGMFAALYLARCKARPIVIERGSTIEHRIQEVEAFLQKKILNIRSNVQFGEGGAGAFSDGKLTTNLHSPYNDFILQEFFAHGADEDITYSATPHIGTDRLAEVVRNIRQEIMDLGGEFHFNTLFEDMQVQSDGSIAVRCSDNKTFTTQHLLLCLGHSARDTISMLYAKGLPMQAKAYSMGVRIEHKQQYINKMQYGNFASYLPNAAYKAAVHLADRSVYTFCMCPGGVVMASASEKDTIVTNGMSRKARDEENANAALLVNVLPEDYYHDSPLDGMAFQARYERAAYAVGGDYRAPANLVDEFLKNKVAVSARSVQPSYPHGVVFCDLESCLPTFVVRALREALPLLNKRMPGFAHPDAVLTGVETRSSSPVRILRNEHRESTISGVYPIGEGAGYAGGIMSAALDGLTTAMCIVGER
ncbi:MAG: hypothetical protein J6Y47_09975 [Bacteroidales bacterium]|nr:hypothetical protein [Bacteroidales bacterium]